MENLRQHDILINIYWRDMSLDITNESLDKIINVWVVLLEVSGRMRKRTLLRGSNGGLRDDFMILDLI